MPRSVFAFGHVLSISMFAFDLCSRPLVWILAGSCPYGEMCGSGQAAREVMFEAFNLILQRPARGSSEARARRALVDQNSLAVLFLYFSRFVLAAAFIAGSMTFIRTF